MRAVRQLGMLLLLLVSYVAPAMACALPVAEMTAQERACCEMMKQDCGQMEMPASHGCCQKLSQSRVLTAIQTKPAAHTVTVAVVWLAAFELSYRPIAQNEWSRLADTSPPESPPPSITVLRI